MKNIKVVCFDLYNTLIYLDDRINPFDKIKEKIEGDKIFDFRKILLTERIFSLRDLETRFSHSFIGPIKRDWEDVWVHAGGAKIFDETSQVLKILRKKGYLIAVVSNLAVPYSRVYYEIGLNRYVDKNVFSFEVGLVKPDFEIFEIIFSTFNVSPSECLMIGDSYKSDYVGGINSGMKAILLNRRKRDIDIPNIKSLSGIFGHLPF